uniref:Sulfatase N-terminal domain-containing protein n=1 Tax=Panagrolaimus superbus TaxID=310955 RepID=A0A914YJB2_9BILA
MPCEFMEIACWKQFPPFRIYSNLHHWIFPKPDIINPGKASTHPSVILFVLDSISQSNWKRYLPKTLGILKDLYNSTIFEGFTKVGDNSFPNAAAFLTGKRVQTVGYESEMASDMSDKFFDDWPIIWKDFKQKGYVTYYAEDYPEYNLFKYLSNGFKESPTDHYFRPFWLQLYGSFLHRRSTHLCYGNQKCHQIQMEYLKEFIEAYNQKSPIFALNWLTELGHDWLEQVSIGDLDISQFFKEQHKNLKDSFVIVFADHGHRFDPIRQSMIGRIEERMPFFSISIPENIRKKVPKLNEIIAENSKKLTSFWDLYITLKDILDLSTTNSWESLNSNAAQNVPHFRQYSPRGLSLLRSIPTKRNCLSAGIPEDFCICQRETQISVLDVRVQEAAKKVVIEVNRLLEPEMEQCSTLFLDKIEHAQTFLPNEKIAFDGNAGFYVMYRVALTVKPSNAFLEGTIRHLISDENDYTIIGDINRINKYGNQSNCVNIPLLRKYCFCKNYL